MQGFLKEEESIETKQEDPFSVFYLVGPGGELLNPVSSHF
jgi:hypothetical protein